MNKWKLRATRGGRPAHNLLPAALTGLTRGLTLGPLPHPYRRLPKPLSLLDANCEEAHNTPALPMEGRKAHRRTLRARGTQGAPAGASCGFVLAWRPLSHLPTRKRKRLLQRQRKEDMASAGHGASGIVGRRGGGARSFSPSSQCAATSPFAQEFIPSSTDPLVEAAAAAMIMVVMPPHPHSDGRRAGGRWAAGVIDEDLKYGVVPPKSKTDPRQPHAQEEAEIGGTRKRRHQGGARFSGVQGTKATTQKTARVVLLPETVEYYRK
ncbi:hypothetical protein E2C01_060444 [Portunus trituberculatus]|uniref:Uncharacterized protein n=1 Tax=Portunus trituberculatus TaxID=210409 RepID=A0A5B7HAI4_PORTR|nr:hypothetical protein [Portunus trituberculatus]